MFATTFLGHQGWMFRAGQSCILVDPLLCEDFGQAHALEYRVFPPRVWQLEQLPAVTAVVLTHEHDDHFDIPSLARLDRRVPIYLSARSSVAAFRILTDMGFAVCPLVPGASVKFRELELYPLVGDHVAHDGGDEWDTLPFVVRDAHGDGSFFSSVDVALTRGLLERARAWCPKPGLVGWTNNRLDRSHMTSFAAEQGDESSELAREMLAGHELVREAWGEPSALLLCGGGFFFHGERSWLNHRFFGVDASRAKAHLNASGAAFRYDAPTPGQTFVMSQGVLEERSRESPFLATAPSGSWPSRHKKPSGPVPDYRPATGREEMTAQDVDRLRRELQELADALPGSRLFRGLYSLLGVELAGLKCTFGLVLRHGSRAAVFEYHPNGCAFHISRVEHPRDAYIAGLECWGTDLLAVLSGELSPIALSFGRAWLWNRVPERLDFCLLSELYRISHPLRKPAAYYETYRRVLENCGAPSA
jgi:hypothetical protein